MYDGAGLRRSITAEVAEDARLLAVESFIFGRAAMGETLRSVSLRDRWRIRRGGNLIFADDIALSGALPSTAATLGNAGAMATIVLISPDAEAMVEGAREYSAASAWSGKLVARLLAQDSFDLRKSLIPLLHLLAGGIPLPKAWSL